MLPAGKSRASSRQRARTASSRSSTVIRAASIGASICALFFACAKAANDDRAPTVSRQAPESISSQAFAPEAFPRASTKFTALDAATTGIRAENRYDDPKMRGELYREFDTSSIGSGVAIGDFDGDGRTDIFIVRKSDSCRLFRNLGDWKFDDVTERAGLGESPEASTIWKQGAAFVDVNNDGRLDLYVCRFNAPNLLFINQGDGTFKEEAAARGLAVKDSSVMAAFCDYDRDGWLDVYITTNILDVSAAPEGQAGYLFHNNRDGTFSDVTNSAKISGIGQSHSATWWDFDNDGRPDLYVANDYGVADRLYRNNGDGTFTDVMETSVPHTAFSAMGSDVGDVNNDGLDDLLVADMAATTHEADQRFLADSRSKAEEPDHTPKYHRNALLLATGTSHLREAANLEGLAATDWTWSVRFEDLDNDGWLDLFVTNGFHRTPSVDLIRRLGTAASADERRKIMLASPAQIEANIALRNLGDLHFENVGAAWGLDQKGISFGAAFGDLDGDGDLDLVFTNYRGEVSVLRNDSGPEHRVIFHLRGAQSNRFGIGAKITLETAKGRQTRTLTLARGYLSTSEPIAHFGLGAETLIRRVSVLWPSGETQSFQNLPADCAYTITEAKTPGERPMNDAFREEALFVRVNTARAAAMIAKEAEVDETTAQPLLPLRLNRRGPSLAITSTSEEKTNVSAENAATGKHNSAERFLAIGGTTLTPAHVEQLDSNGALIEGKTTALPLGSVNDGPLAWLDVDGDGHEDLLVTRAGNAVSVEAGDYQPRLYLGDGYGGIHEAETSLVPKFAASVGALAVGDFDRDGNADVFIGARHVPGNYPEIPASALWQNRSGKLEDVTDAIAPSLRKVGMVTAALWCDVDSDGWSDLVVALDWGNVRVFRNECGVGFTDWTEKLGFDHAGTGWWRSLASADFNGDGHPDFALGDVGLNTTYRADGQHPALLYAGHFRPDKKAQLIEAYFEGEKIFPWRTRDELGGQIPSIARIFSKNENYARATLAQILGETRLSEARRLAATELRNGILLSQPDGVYRFEALPRIAQISPASAMVAGDFDGDGHADLYLAQNDHSPIPSVGNFDGGLSQLLLGDGTGHFTAVPPARSGLIVRGDAKCVVAFPLEREGEVEFVVSQNNDAVMFFNNHGVVKKAPAENLPARK